MNIAVRIFPVNSMRVMKKYVNNLKTFFRVLFGVLFGVPFGVLFRVLFGVLFRVLLTGMFLTLYF